ncbi:LytR/AlgR family response regulator transcription factor [Chryseobacterium hagamense]|uniref:DNA-binding response regulator n=1 Tax=Chryseobacterium hagamense TaxID=395935 RepID=A0A511YPW1_9FLAO|nr:LytTR family DNA-binding domain-containing protein [Chryseobacterium hagamense]GEN77223.1 DNA-binding response regulator [Chryseobacterium hagamense]
MKRNLCIVLIEDEPATARNLEHIIKEINPAVRLITVLASVKESLNWFPASEEDYDLIFSDIRLSDGLSFEIFSRIPLKKPVIFVTAYNDYAIDAFRNNGIDYILKPFDREEIRRALTKYEDLFTSGTEAGQHQTSAAVLQLQPSFKSYKRSFLIHYCGRLIPVEAAKIHWFHTAYETVYAHTAQGSQYVIGFTLEQLEQHLDPAVFFRANRQFIINRNAVETVEYFFNGRLLVTVTPLPDEKVLVSKAKATMFRKWLDQ